MQNYGELKTTLANWINREDLTDQIPDFIALAEADIYRTLRCRDNEFEALYFQGAINNYEQTYLPYNFLEMRGVYWNGRPLVNVSLQELQKLTLESSGDLPYAFAIASRRILFHGEIPADRLEWGLDDQLEYYYYGWESLTGKTASWGQTTSPFNPLLEPESVATTIEQGIPPEDLSQPDEATTRLLLRQPNLYLYGALHHAHDFLQKHDEADRWLNKFGQVMAAIEGSTAEAEFTGSTVRQELPYAV